MRHQWACVQKWRSEISETSLVGSLFGFRRAVGATTCSGCGCYALVRVEQVRGETKASIQVMGRESCVGNHKEPQDGPQ